MKRRTLLRTAGAGTAMLVAGHLAGCAPASLAPTATGGRPSHPVETPSSTETLSPTVTLSPAPRTITSDSFARAAGAQLLLGDSPYRAIGANVPHLHQAYFGTWHHNLEIYGTHARAKQAIVAAIADAERSKIAFFRFFANPGYPVDAQFYLDRPDDYWARMDELFALCRDHHIKLIPSLGVLFTWPMICGEPRQAMLDPGSRTYQATHRYVQEFVSRYKDDPTVLLWELENEGFLTADVNMQGRKALGKGQYPAGSTIVKEQSTLEDSLTFSNLLAIYAGVTAAIKRLDANHLVTSGDAGVRDASQSLRESFPGQVWTADTLRQHLSNLLASQPEPLDVFSVHAYIPQQHQKLVGELPALEYLRTMIRSIHAARAPLFIGEIGQLDPTFEDDSAATWARQAIDMIEQDQVALAALWVWHFPWQTENTMDGNSHPLLVQRVAEFNTKYAGL